MVDSDRGITNLHVPSDVIIDASMPAMIRTSGQMWNAAGDQQDAKAVIPDSSYAALYAETIDHCREHGAFDPATMGTTPNVGLMAQKAEEYGSHDKTFEIEAAGHGARASAPTATCCSSTRSRPATCGAPARPRTRRSPTGCGWPSSARATPARRSSSGSTRRARTTRRCSRSSTATCPSTTPTGLQIEVMPVAEATRFTLERARAGEDTIAATGNVLRDYLTDLFPILELGTSAKMLSIVPLMNGGGLFETGAGGSAPKHVQQLVKENHLRWDSLGEFLALAVSLEMLADKDGNPRAKLLGQALDRATGSLLENGKSPSRKVGELDNRGSHYWLARYWARELADQSEDAELAEAFEPLAERLEAEEEAILSELEAVQGERRRPRRLLPRGPRQGDAVMRPSETFNEAIGVAVTLTLDHVIVRTADPAAALAELADRGGLPVLAAVEEVGGLHSGIARAGSIDVEVLQDRQGRPAGAAGLRARLHLRRRPGGGLARAARARLPDLRSGARGRRRPRLARRAGPRPAARPVPRRRPARSRRAWATGSPAAPRACWPRSRPSRRPPPATPAARWWCVTDYEFDAAAWRGGAGRGPEVLEVHVNTGGHLTDWQRVPVAEDMLLRFSDDEPAGVTRHRARGRARGVRGRGCDRRVPPALGSAASQLNSGG